MDSAVCINLIFFSNSIVIKINPASVVWVATSLNSKLIVVAGVANQPRIIVQLKNLVSNALEVQFSLHRSAMIPSPDVIITRRMVTEFIMGMAKKSRGHT